jgi:alpha-L-rhamnosidase
MSFGEKFKKGNGMKTKWFVLFSAAVMGLILTNNASAGTLSVCNLRCESRTEPLGIDVTVPVLSWVLQSDQRKEVQSAYRVLTATSQKLLEQNTGDLWDSGKISSDQQNSILYHGKALASCQQVFWKVMVWDKKGRASDWSQPAIWTMGIMNEADWKAKWISAKGAEKYALTYKYSQKDFRKNEIYSQPQPNAPQAGDANYSSMLLRREFEVKPGLIRAVIQVSGLGHYELCMNGDKIGDYLLAPGWTNYRKTVLYDTYDVTRQIKTGKNAIGIMLGNGMYNIQPDPVRFVKFINTFGPLKAIAHMRLEYSDGSVKIIGTDAAWQVAPGPVTYSNVFGGEDYDARLEPQGWNQPGFKAVTPWAAAIETSGPGGVLRGLSCAAPPIRAIETLPSIAAKPLRPDVTVYDLGQNASLMPQLVAKGPAGSYIRIIPSELLKPDGFVDRNSCTQDGVRPAWWQYTLIGNGSENWFPKFFYQGCRYLQVECYPAKEGDSLPTVESIQGVVVHSSSSPIGEFSCSNSLFNRIYTLVRWAQRSNMVSLMTDCPHREKLGWIEQTHLNGPSLRYNFDMVPLLAKAVNDMSDSQLENGLVPNITPEYFIAGLRDMTNGFRNSPEWGSAFVIVPWQQYQFTGDISLLSRNYAAMKRYVAFLGSTAQNGIVSIGLGDWYDLGPKPPWGSQLTPEALTATAFYYYDNWILAQMARLLGKSDEAAQFAALAVQIRDAFNKKFYNPQNGQYATGSQCANSIPLVMDLVEPANRTAVFDAIVADVRGRGNALTAGDVGYRYLLQALADGGRSDVIFDMNNQSQRPGYGYQLKMGATSLTEKWDAGVGSFGSQNHFMLGQINEWLYAGLAGIRIDPDAPGFKKIIIKPTVVGDLTWVKGGYDTVRGRIVSEWKREDGRLSLNVTIPPNTTATVFVPAQRDEDVREGSGPAAKADGVQFVRMENNFAVYQIGSGSYQFSATIANMK